MKNILTPPSRRAMVELEDVKPSEWVRLRTKKRVREQGGRCGEHASSTNKEEINGI
jgi:hypothetical protein